MLLKKRLNLAIIQIIAALLLIACATPTGKELQNAQLIPYRSATELTRMIRQGEITSQALLEIYIERIERYNGGVNAVVATNYEAARKRAKAADKALARGEDWGPLHGLPITVKDVFETVGMPATSGDPALKTYVPEKNAIAVQRLVDAGAIVFGKTNTPYHAMDIQSYNEVYGTTNNPWDVKRTPGGSSGGSAAALAAGLTALELGSDLGGSVRIPAHYSGVYGHKPTFGIVPRYGHIPPMPPGPSQEFMPYVPLFVVGPMARSADDLELAMRIISPTGEAPRKDNSRVLHPPRKQRLADFRVAVMFSDPSSKVALDAQVLQVLENTVEKLRAAGVRIDAAARPEMGMDEINDTYGAVYRCLEQRQIPLPQEVVDKQKRLMAVMETFFRQYDVLLMPVTPTVAFAHDHAGTFVTRKILVNGEQYEGRANLYWTLMAVAAGLPATAAPVGLSGDGLPVGIQIVGAAHDDLTTIAFARELARISGGCAIPPGYEK